MWSHVGIFSRDRTAEEALTLRIIKKNKMVSVACNLVFRHQHLTITRRKDSKNQQPSVGSTVSFIISPPLTTLFFSVQKVSPPRHPPADAETWSRQLKRKHKNGFSEREQRSCLICRPTAPDRHLADATTSLPSRLLHLKEHRKNLGVNYCHVVNPWAHIISPPTW